MNNKDFSAIIFIAITSIFLIGYRLNREFINDYQSAYLRQTTPVTPTYLAGYTSPVISQDVVNLLEPRPVLPVLYGNLIDVEDYENMPLDFEYIPFFWHVYRSAGGTMKQLMGECLGLTLASSFSFPVDFLMKRPEPRIMRFDNVKYFNVNMQTQEGMHRAKNMDLIHRVDTDIGPVLADAVISPDINSVLNIFFSKKDRYSIHVPGGLFMMFRNPIEREISNFYAVRSQSEDPVVSTLALSDWINLPSYLGNSMVRQLAQQMDPAVNVTLNDLMIAKEVIRRKCIVGLLEEKQESWNRFQHIFKKRWNMNIREPNPACHERLLNWGWRNQNSVKPFIDISVEDPLQREHESIVDKSTYKKIGELNQLDMLLYEYAKYIFLEQSALFNTEKVNVIPGNNEDNATQTNDLDQSQSNVTDTML